MRRSGVRSSSSPPSDSSKTRTASGSAGFLSSAILPLTSSQFLTGCPIFVPGVEAFGFVWIVSVARAFKRQYKSVNAALLAAPVADPQGDAD